MSPRTRVLTLSNAAFMGLVWVTRIRNAAGDDTISNGTRAAAFLLSAVCLGGAAALVVLALRGIAFRWVAAIVVAHAAIWLVRGTQIALGERSLGFKAVHVMLAVVSILLAAAVLRANRVREATS